MENDMKNDMENDNNEEYVEIQRDTIYNIIFVVCSICCFLIYKTNSNFGKFIDTNIDYISNTLDIALLCIVFIIIPYIYYWLKIFAKILRRLWISFHTFSIRLSLKIFRVNISIIGFSSTILALAFDKPFLSIHVAIPSILFWIIMNWFFLDYNLLKEQEDELVEYYKSRNKSKWTPEISYFQIISFIIILINFSIISLRFPNEKTLGEIELEIISRINADIIQSILFWTAFIFTFIWFAISFLLGLIINFILDRKEKALFSMKVLFFMAIIYIIAKLVMFNITSGQDPTTSTLYSTLVTGVSAICYKNSKKIIRFISKSSIEVD